MSNLNIFQDFEKIQITHNNLETKFVVNLLYFLIHCTDLLKLRQFRLVKTGCFSKNDVGFDLSGQPGLGGSWPAQV